MTQIDSDIIHSQSRLSDEPIIVLDNEGAGNLVKLKQTWTKDRKSLHIRLNRIAFSQEKTRCLITKLPQWLPTR